jgi:septum formation protein
MEAPFWLMMWRSEMVAQMRPGTEAIRIVLASASPRRAELLRAAGIAFDVAPAHVDETVPAGESPEQYVRGVAEAKARAIHRRYPGRVILAADTTVVLGGEILAKPVDAGDAVRMLRLLSGRSHDVLTGVTVVSGEGASDSRVARTTVEFAPLTAAEIDWYVASGEPMDKAGAYAIQGLASRFVRRIDGSYSNVVGLPVALVYEMLRRAGEAGAAMESSRQLIG